MGYVRIRSWHNLLTFTRDGGVKTVCGRRIPPPIATEILSQTLPLDEKSCETCLRLGEHQKPPE